MTDEEAQDEAGPEQVTDDVAEDSDECDERSRGLPPDWGHGRGVERYTLPADWVKLLVRYKGMYPAPALEEIFKITVGREAPTEAMREREYIDEDYRDEYAHFYAKTYRPLPSRCERLHFFVDPERQPEGQAGDDAPDTERPAQGQRYLGYVVLRPIIGRPVSRTMLAPPAWVARHVACSAPATATVHGFPLQVKGFPFISQDSQFGSCSHAAMWMISVYFHLRYRKPRHHISDLAASARIHQDLPPSVPSAGLTPRQISAVLHDLDMPPVIYRLDRRLPDDESPESIACRYLNSGLPVMLLQGGDHYAGHAQVLIGYGRDNDGLFFVQHDDQVGPYIVQRRLPQAGDVGDESDAGSRAWHALIVPLPGRIYLSGEAAERAGRLIFDVELERGAGEGHPRLNELVGGLDDERLRLRSYLIEVSDYKRRLHDRRLPDEVVSWHVSMSTSHWLWVVELQDRTAATAGPDCVVGEVVFDATSDDQWVNPLFANLPGLLMAWPSLGDDVEVADYADEGALYRTGCALHVPS